MDLSPLNGISADIRLCIYEFSLCTQGDISIILEDQQHISEGSAFVRPRTPQPNLLSLIRTCKQIRNEALPIFLAQNHFKIYVDRAIGSIDTDLYRYRSDNQCANKVNEVRLVAQMCFDYYAVFGRQASYMKNLTICMGDSEFGDYAGSLSVRQSLIEELRLFFGLAGPYITMELDLSGDVTSKKRPNLCPTIRSFPAVPAIRIELSYAKDVDNKAAIAAAVSYAKRTAFERGYAWNSYIDFLQERHRRALDVLDALSQEQLGQRRRRS